MCGESWLAIKDSLIHHPSSQGWASLCPLVITIVLYSVHVHVYLWLCVYCLSGLPFFPSYFYVS